ncbi:hypothetical protein CC2G_002713 [Coprinopsis cinerea AmutBmut pab1-1]|nr:hypothetical protein CC2G_002713 [Coprinopsis cinerea AmutBmut pab1-1]
MAVAPTTRPKKAARGPSRNTSLTKSGARHKGRRPTGKEPRPRPERPVYRDTVERIKWFTARAEILAILTPTEARCKICDRTLQLERPKKTVKNNTQGGYYHHNARKHLLTKTHQRKMEVWQERKRLELAAAERIRVRMSLAHLCGPSVSSWDTFTVDTVLTGSHRHRRYRVPAVLQPDRAQCRGNIGPNEPIVSDRLPDVAQRFHDQRATQLKPAYLASPTLRARSSSHPS